MAWKQLGMAFDTHQKKGKLDMSETLRSRAPKRTKVKTKTDYIPLAPGELDDDLDGIL
jgi:hypothetical protein